MHMQPSAAAVHIGEGDDSVAEIAQASRVTCDQEQPAEPGFTNTTPSCMQTPCLWL